MPVEPTPSRNKNQAAKFVDAARELGCDEDEAAFEDKLRRVAKQRPKPESGEGKDDEAPDQ